jgi:hypothetical protein
MKLNIDTYLTPIDGEQAKNDKLDNSFNFDEFSDLIRGIEKDYINDENCFSDSSTLFNSPEKFTCVNTKYRSEVPEPIRTNDFSKVNFDISLKSSNKGCKLKKLKPSQFLKKNWKEKIAEIKEKNLKLFISKKNTTILKENRYISQLFYPTIQEQNLNYLRYLNLSCPINLTNNVETTSVKTQSIFLIN